MFHLSRIKINLNRKENVQRKCNRIHFQRVIEFLFKRNRFDETNTTYDSNLYARPHPAQGIIPSLPLSMPLHSQRPPFCPVMYPSNPSSSLFHRAAWSSHPLYSSYSPSRNCYIWKICIPLSGKNDFVEIVEWICPIREIYMEFYHFIANDELNPLWNAIENVISLFR